MKGHTLTIDLTCQTDTPTGCDWCDDRATHTIGQTPLCAACWEYAAVHWTD